LLEGRAPGQRGAELAAKYIATQFALYGLRPAGDAGSYLQEVSFVGMKVVPAETSFAFEPEKGSPVRLTYSEDYTVSNQTLTPKARIDAPIVFVGFGVAAPEFGWDDYAGVNVKGKVVLCIVGSHLNVFSCVFPAIGRKTIWSGLWLFPDVEPMCCGNLNLCRAAGTAPRRRLVIPSTLAFRIQWRLIGDFKCSFTAGIGPAACKSQLLPN
jgi:hypothetical protein